MDPINLGLFTINNWFDWMWLILSLSAAVWWPMKFWGYFNRPNDDGSKDPIQVWHVIIFLITSAAIIGLPWLMLFIYLFIQTCRWIGEVGWPTFSKGFVWCMDYIIVPGKEGKTDD